MSTAAPGDKGQTKAGERAAGVVRTEAAALEAMARRLEGSEGEAFERALDSLVQTVQGGRSVVLCGMGKSGLIARKIAATLVSLGVPAFFLHPAEAAHGDLGLLRAGDALLALSYSGETEELLRLLPAVARMGVSVTSFCGCADSALARASAHALDVSVDREACAHQLAPTASSTAMLALGDALAIELSQRLGFAPQLFADLHPGGQLGRRLRAVREVMHTGEAVPVVAPGAAMPEIMHEMSAKRLGMTTVQRDGLLLGVLSDGDLRRWMEREGPEAFHRTAAEVMNPAPRAVGPAVFVSDALELMERHKITSLVVTGSGTANEAGPISGPGAGPGSVPGSVAGSVQSPGPVAVLGIVHMHDLVEALGASASRD